MDQDPLPVPAFEHCPQRPGQPRSVSVRPGSRILPLVLLGLTFLSTLVAGFLMDLQFSVESEELLVERLVGVWSHPLDLLAGLPFSLAILSILLAHEMGHYLACRHYGLDATLPFLLPAPPVLMPFGTFGGVIRIRSMFLDRRQLFDVGIAGPLAGMAVVIPALVLGIHLSGEWEPVGHLSPSLEFGEPLLFQLAARIFFEGDPALIRLHPIGWAAWFGMLATSLNLLPVGQLDGGHITYALFGQRKHRLISLGVFASLILLSLVSWPMAGYLVFAGVLLLMRFRHPPPFFDAGPLGRKRLVLAWVSASVFILTFIPVPVRWIEHTGTL